MTSRRKGLFVQVSTKLWCDDDHDCSLAAWGLWLKLLSYCGDATTDGQISARQYRRITVDHDPEECQLAMKELTEKGLLSEAADGWQMVGYAKWNKTKKEIDATRKAAAERAKRSRNSKGKQ